MQAPVVRANKTSQWLVALGLMLAVALTLFSFWKALDGPFVFDDFPNLQNLEQINGEITPGSVQRYLHAFNGNPGRPLSALSFLIEDHAWPSEPRAFKRNNLLLHCLMGLLLFLLARRLALELPRWAPHAQWIALAATAMWLLHPMQLSATMLVVQRMNILAMMCIVLGLLAYLRLIITPPERAPPGVARVLAALAALAGFAVIAVLFKENGALLPVYALALNLTLLAPRIQRMPTNARRLLLAGTALPLLILVAAPLLSASSILDGYVYRDFSLGERLLTQPRIVFDYLGSILLPSLGGQGIFHDDYEISRSLWQPWTTALSVAALAGLLFAAWRFRTRAPVFTFTVAWFVAGHLMESTVVALELYFEHRNYLPMFGVLLAVAGTAISLGGRYRPAAGTALALWIALAASLTLLNSATWGDRGKLALVWLAESPGAVRAVQMAASYQADEGQLDAARRTLDDGIARSQQANALRFQRILLDCVTRGVTPDQWKAMQALAAHTYYQRSIPDVVAALANETRAGRCHGTITEADVEALILTLFKNPAIARLSEPRGFLYYELAKFARDRRDLDQLMTNLDASYALRPTALVAREQAIHLLSAGLPDEALGYLDLSERTPAPKFKAWLLDIETMNAPLRRSALQIQAVQQANSQAAEIRR